MRVIKRWAGAVVLFHAVGFDLTGAEFFPAPISVRRKNNSSSCVRAAMEKAGLVAIAPRPHQQSRIARPNRAQIEKRFKSGTPGGMPAFTLPESQLTF